MCILEFIVHFAFENAVWNIRMKSNTTTTAGWQIYKQTDVPYINITLFMYSVRNKMEVSSEEPDIQMFQVI